MFGGSGVRHSGQAVVAGRRHNHGRWPLQTWLLRTKVSLSTAWDPPKAEWEGCFRLASLLLLPLRANRQRLGSSIKCGGHCGLAFWMQTTLRLRQPHLPATAQRASMVDSCLPAAAWCAATTASPPGSRATYSHGSFLPSGGGMACSHLLGQHKEQPHPPLAFHRWCYVRPRRNM